MTESKVKINSLTESNKLYLNVPFELKDQIKKFGGKWNQQ